MQTVANPTSLSRLEENIPASRRVVTGPIEATAIGNTMMQAVSHGDVGSIEEAREVVRNSFPMKEFVPTDPDPWDEAYQRFIKLCT